MIGKQLGNRYEILEQLGGGGMAIVYKGRDTFLNRLVTIKMLRPEFSSDQDFTRRFRREAQAVASLSHPHIVSIYDVGQEEGVQYLVMEYVDGEDLKTLIRREGALDVARAVQIALQVLEALEHAHENNIVHRDIKPHNILLTRSGRAKLTDFGIAREATAATVTQTDTIVGSVHYLSPEQARGEVAGPKSDIYSLGVVLYEMLTGTVPFAGDSPISVAIKHIQEEPEPPSRRNPAIPPALEQVVLRALAKNPGQRFASAREMAVHLEDIFRGDGEEATRFIPVDEMATRVIKPAGQSWKRGRGEVTPSRRRKLRPAGWAALAVLLLALLAGGGFALHRFLNVPEVQVPSVVRYSLADAERILAERGLDVAVRREHSDTVPEGYVIDQDIGPEDPPVKPPRVITLTVSLGPDRRVVPDLYRLNLDQARQRLSESGLSLAEPAQEGYDDNVPPGLIFQQSPAAGDKVAPNSRVTVYLSRGPKPRQVQVPDLTGMNREQARAKLAESQLSLDENVQWENSTDFLPDQIIRQDPAANTPVNQGTAVKVVLSKGPGPMPGEALVRFSVPDDGKNHQVKITVSDVRGSNVAHANPHPPGSKVETTVRYLGQAIIRVYIDDKLVREQRMEGGQKDG
ncbi:MAG: Stk1 family PASTA domain-containing Ser/Thr kinase [Thermoanaerobacteraceae bacterium]|nr:Stk1 family PASTA domain-containing Ser/Thr kinase [Thermoanaerobacteraceae bacterium]